MGLAGAVWAFRDGSFGKVEEGVPSCSFFEGHCGKTRWRKTEAVLKVVDGFGFLGHRGFASVFRAGWFGCNVRMEVAEFMSVGRKKKRRVKPDSSGAAFLAAREDAALAALMPA